MKLKLEAIRDISVLVAEGAITSENMAILRAGIKKLFRDGKNKIILELPDSGTFTPEILREFAHLNLMAAELSGSIVLTSIAPLTRTKIEAFAKPPVVRCFANRDEGVAFFHPKVEEEAKSSPPPAPAAAAPAPIPAPAPVAAATTPAVETAAVPEEQTKQLKADIRAQELGDLGSVRKKLSELELENKELKDRFTDLIVTRRDPPDLESWREKVTLLEKQLAETIKTAQEAAGAKGAPKK